MSEEEKVDDGMYYPPGYQKPEVISEEDNNPESNSKGEQEDPTEKITQGWADDRAKLEETESENRRMKIQLSKNKESEEDEELDGMTEDERVSYLVNKKETARKNDSVTKKELDKSEIKFKRLTNKYFANNEKGILKFKRDNDLTLTQSIKLFKNTEEEIKKAKGKGKIPVQNQKSKGNVRVYDRKADQNKSISDLFRGY